MKTRAPKAPPPSGPAASTDFPPQGARLYFDLSVYWFALGFLWAGTITIVIQTLVERMAGSQKDAYLAYTLAIGALVSTVVCLVVGTMSDRSRWAMGRRRPYVIAGTLLSVPALLWLARVDSIPVLMLDFCLIQLWVNVATAPYQAMMPDNVPRHLHGAASAYYGMASLLGQLGGLIAAGLLISRPAGLLALPASNGVRLISVPSGLAQIVVMFSVLLLGSMVYTVLRVPDRSALNNPAPRIGLLATMRESFRVSPREHPDFFRLIASRFVINMGFYSVTAFLLYYVGDTLHAPNKEDVVTAIFVIATVSGLLGNFPAGILSDRMSKKRVVYASTTITGIGVMVFLLTSSIPVALGASFIFGAGFGGFMAVDWAFATNLLPEKDEAKHMGVWHIAFTVPQVVAPLIGGLAAQAVNNSYGPGSGYRVVMFLAAAYLAIGTAMIRPIRERMVTADRAS